MSYSLRFLKLAYPYMLTFAIFPVKDIFGKIHKNITARNRPFDSPCRYAP